MKFHPDKNQADDAAKTFMDISEGKTMNYRLNLLTLYYYIFILNE